MSPLPRISLMRPVCRRTVKCVRPALSSLSRLNALRSASTTKNKPETHTHGSHRNLIIKFHDFSITIFTLFSMMPGRQTQKIIASIHHIPGIRKESHSVAFQPCHSAPEFVVWIGRLKKCQKNNFPTFSINFYFFMYSIYMATLQSLYLWSSNH